VQAGLDAAEGKSRCSSSSATAPSSQNPPHRKSLLAPEPQFTKEIFVGFVSVVHRRRRPLGMKQAIRLVFAEGAGPSRPLKEEGDNTRAFTGMRKNSSVRGFVSGTSLLVPKKAAK